MKFDLLGAASVIPEAGYGMKLDPEQMNFGDARVCRNDGRGQARVRDHEWSWLAALDDFRNWPIREAA